MPNIRIKFYFASCCNSAVLFDIPPLYPVISPCKPTTRWHGIMIHIGFHPTAPPTARAETRGTPICLAILFAIFWYDIVAPNGIFFTKSRTAHLNGVIPFNLYRGVQFGMLPPKYISNHRRVSSNIRELCWVGASAGVLSVNRNFTRQSPSILISMLEKPAGVS